MGDPDHLPISKIFSLYSHLLGRQRRRLPPFVVLNAAPHHPVVDGKSQKSEKAKGKQKAKYVPVSDDEDGEGGTDKGEGGLDEDQGEPELEERKDETPEEELEQVVQELDVGEEEEEVVIPKVGPPKGKKRNVSKKDAGSSKVSPAKIPKVNFLVSIVRNTVYLILNLIIRRKTRIKQKGSLKNPRSR